MGCTRRDFVSLASAAALLGLSACAQSAEPQVVEEQPPAPEEPAKQEEEKVDLKEFEKLALKTDAWQYDKENDVYYQLGVPYCLSPGSESYESLAIFVPGAYFTAKEHGKTFACEINEKGKVGSFTAKTAPVAMPINSGTLSPQACPTTYGYSGLKNYLESGCVYVYAGFRGRSSGYEGGEGKAGAFSGGAPWPVVDLKAAVRFLRYNAAVLPFDASRIFTFGFSMGGGVSTLMGTTGDSELYAPYLEHIGAATHDAEGENISDAVFGSASWCPVTSFDSADASYEWMMGQYQSDGTRAEGVWTRELSGDLSRSYAAYVNEMDFRDDDDQPLTLDETSGEIYADGSYYAYLLSCLQDSAAEFLAHAQFPYTYTPHHVVNASFPGDPNLQSDAAGASDVEAITGDASAQAASGSKEGDKASDGTAHVESVVYDSQADYVNSLNNDKSWLTFNESRETVRITSIGDFVGRLKGAAKDVCAFDATDRSTVENQLFGVDDAGSLHFSKMVGDLIASGREKYAKLDGWSNTLVKDWSGDLKEVDALKTSMDTRVNMFNPLYFVSGAYQGYGLAAVAPHWRINSGAFQTDTSLCTELNLALALKHYEGVKDVALNLVWGRGHELCEKNGSSEDNLIAWILECCKE